MSKSIGTHHQQILSKLLRQFRLDAGISQSDLADLLGKPQSFVSKYEIGERRLDILELRQVCRALKIELTDFVDKLENKLNESKSPLS